MATIVQEPETAAAEPPPVPARPVAGGFVAEVGELVQFAGATLWALPGSATYMSEALRHTSKLILTTTPFLFIMYVFQGFVTMNTGYFILFPLGAADYLGLIGGFGIHVSGVIMFGYAFTSKVCGGYVAEIGAMRINQEIEACESTGVDPLRFIVGTRILAVILYLPIALVVSLLGYTAGCFIDAILIINATDAAGYARFHWASQGISEIWFVFTTFALTAVATAITACFYGMRTRGGPDAVGAAVAQSVKFNLVLSNIVICFTVLTWYVADPGVPIGG